MRPGATGWGVDGDPLFAFGPDGRESRVPAVPGNLAALLYGIRDACRIATEPGAADRSVGGDGDHRSRRHVLADPDGGPVPLTREELRLWQEGG